MFLKKCKSTFMESQARALMREAFRSLETFSRTMAAFVCITRVSPASTPAILWEKSFNLKLSSNKVYRTNDLQSLIKIILCSNLHHFFLIENLFL